MRPSTTALGIPELLEMVLDHATPQDLLLWQRVNKAWQATIQRSPRFQERLFFRTKETWKTMPNRAFLVKNPFLERFENTSGWVTTCHFSHDAFDGKKASHPTASWRQMHLSSPAMTDLEAITLPRCNGRVAASTIVIFRITCMTGITVGQFADTIKEHAAFRGEAGENAETRLYIFRVPNL